jgi:hypothetical protein
VPSFLKRQVFVKAWPAWITVPSGMVTSVTNSAMSQDGVALADTLVAVGMSVGGATVVTIGNVDVTVGSSGADWVSWACTVWAAAVEA